MENKPTTRIINIIMTGLFIIIAITLITITGSFYTVEQNAKKALTIADRAYVLETGRIVLQGDAKDLLNNESVKKAYLGE